MKPLTKTQLAEFRERCISNQRGKASDENEAIYTASEVRLLLEVTIDVTDPPL